MPIKVMESDDDGSERVNRYSWPAEYVTPVDGVADALRQWRKAAIKSQEEFSAAQKQCGRDDPDGARFFKTEARYHLKLQRACTYMLPWFGEADRAQATDRPCLWPVELVSELDEISRRIVMRFG